MLPKSEETFAASEETTVPAYRCTMLMSEAATLFRSGIIGATASWISGYSSSQVSRLLNHCCAVGTKRMMEPASAVTVLTSWGSTMLLKMKSSRKTSRIARIRLSSLRLPGLTSGFPFLFSLLSSRSNRRMGTLRMKAIHPPTTNGENAASDAPSQPPTSLK